MKRHVTFRRLATTLVSAACALVLTAQVAFAGGSGVIRYPNPLAPWVPGTTERALLAEKCLKVPAQWQGFDAWIADLDPDQEYLVISTPNLPEAPVGYTFHVVFYSYYESARQCHEHKSRTPLGNPTPPISTNGGEWAVISLMAGSDVKINWNQCESSHKCSI